MGSSSSKFRKHLSNGDEVAALNLYNSNSDLRKALDPNSSYKDSHQHETPLHYAAKHGMKSLLRIFLRELGGNPNKTNGRKETCLHCVCMEKPCNAQYYPVQRKRADCLTLLLNWRGATLKDGEVEKIDLGAQDEIQNTALHYAASSGLKRCVEMLVTYGAPLFLENKEDLTPCDMAEKNGHSEIAVYLESKMVFSNDETEEEHPEAPPVVDSEDYSGLRAQDLQEAKDQLLVETADMLSVPLFTADALLRNHEWSREMLLESWMSDPMACCEKAGVTPPPSLFSDKPEVQESLTSPTSSEPPSPDTMCDICTQSFLIEEEPVHMACKHQFCRCCWKEYLNLKIQEGDAHHITCPGFQCSKLVPVEVIENIVSREMARRYLQFDIKAFVDSNPSIKWCPFPGCGRAVRLPDLDINNANQMPRQLPVDTSRAVDCGHKHYFCWDCGGEAHEPCSCDNWTKWYQEIADIKPEQMDGTEKDTESAANCLWLVTNSKPCPNCKSPIQKNEGCNHMKCSKCKHDFCWVCLDQWKRHNSSTGGYFKCNRYEVSKIVEETSQHAQTEAEEKNKKMQQLNKFVHYYTRFKNHENSYKLEEPLASSTKNKMMKLAEAVTDAGKKIFATTANAETKFVEEAVEQLLKARRVLKCSYVYGFYLDGPGYKKIVFEFMQTELEEATEILSQMVNRLYLRTPRKKIIEQAHVVQRKRHEFISAISKGLVPPETPPALRKHRRRRYSMDVEDEELRKAILASIQDVDPANPWIKDASGRHTNITAVLDWPDSDDSDSDSSVLRNQGTCAREGCNKARVKNPRTGEMHPFCSRQCMHSVAMDTTDQSEPVQEAILDEQMDLLRALEMSRLQYLRDQGIIADLSSTTASLLDSPGAAEGGSSPASLDDKMSPQKLTSDPSSPLSKSPRSKGKQPADKKRRSPKRSKDTSTQSGKPKNVATAMEELDIELQRVLELSSISPSEISAESQLLLPKDSQQAQPESLSPVSLPRHKKGVGRFDETTSTVVSRVPNKSVEDLFHDDCVGCRPPPPSASSSSSTELDPFESVGALAGHLLGNVGPDSDFTKGAQPQFTISPPATSANQANLQASGCFGVIKDLSVSNINVGQNDKTREFQGKNLSLLRDQKNSSRSCRGMLAANTPGEDEDNVFVLMSPADAGTSGQPWAYPSSGAYSSQLYRDNRHNVPSNSYVESSSCDTYLTDFKPEDDVGISNQNFGFLTRPQSVRSQHSRDYLSLTQMTENLVNMSEQMQKMVESNMDDPETSFHEPIEAPLGSLENLDELPSPLDLEDEDFEATSSQFMAEVQKNERFFLSPDISSDTYHLPTTLRLLDELSLDTDAAVTATDETCQGQVDSPEKCHFHNETAQISEETDGITPSPLSANLLSHSAIATRDTRRNIGLNVQSESQNNRPIGSDSYTDITVESAQHHEGSGHSQYSMQGNDSECNLDLTVESGHARSSISRRDRSDHDLTDSYLV